MTATMHTSFIASPAKIKNNFLWHHPCWLEGPERWEAKAGTQERWTQQPTSNESNVPRGILMEIAKDKDEQNATLTGWTGTLQATRYNKARTQRRLGLGLNLR